MNPLKLTGAGLITGAALLLLENAHAEGAPAAPPAGAPPEFDIPRFPTTSAPKFDASHFTSYIQAAQVAENAWSSLKSQGGLDNLATVHSMADMFQGILTNFPGVTTLNNFMLPFGEFLSTIVGAVGATQSAIMNALGPELGNIFFGLLNSIPGVKAVETFLEGGVATLKKAQTSLASAALNKQTQDLLAASMAPVISRYTAEQVLANPSLFQPNLTFVNKYGAGVSSQNYQDFAHANEMATQFAAQSQADAAAFTASISHGDSGPNFINVPPPTKTELQIAETVINAGVQGIQGAAPGARIDPSPLAFALVPVAPEPHTATEHQAWLATLRARLAQLGPALGSLLNHAYPPAPPEGDSARALYIDNVAAYEKLYGDAAYGASVGTPYLYPDWLDRVMAVLAQGATPDAGVYLAIAQKTDLITSLTQEADKFLASFPPSDLQRYVDAFVKNGGHFVGTSVEAALTSSSFPYELMSLLATQLAGTQAGETALHLVTLYDLNFSPGASEGFHAFWNSVFADLAYAASEADTQPDPNSGLARFFAAWNERHPSLSDPLHNVDHVFFDPETEEHFSVHSKSSDWYNKAYASFMLTHPDPSKAATFKRDEAVRIVNLIRSTVLPQVGASTSGAGFPGGWAESIVINGQVSPLDWNTLVHEIPSAGNLGSGYGDGYSSAYNLATSILADLNAEFGTRFQ